MEWQESTVTKLLIEKVDGLDPVTVYLENYGKGRGKLTIEVFGDSWSAAWGAMGETRSLEQFVLSAGNHYLSKNLASLSALSEDDYQGFIDNMKTECLTERRCNHITKEEAAKIWAAIDDVIPEKEWFQDSYNHDTLYAVGGAEWWYSIPSVDSDLYKYLCMILDAVKACLRERETKLAA